MDKNKRMRFSDAELQTIKSIFAENEVLLLAIRKSFMQKQLSDSEKNLLDSFKKNSDFQDVLRKTFLPELDGDAPLHQLVDLWMTLNIKDKQPDTVYIEAIAREKLIKYIDQTLIEISGGKILEPIDFSELTLIDDKTEEEVYVDLTVRNTILAHTEQMLQQLSTLAGTKEESVEETLERLKKDSAK